MSKIEKAVAWALAVANDPSHGYDQQNRWGPDYDCSSFVISAFEQAGVPVKSSGATYTGNMRAVFLSCGFKDVTNTVNKATGAGVERGDVLLNEMSHTALYIGGGQIVHAAGNENGRATGGIPGDQSGAEIYERSYYNYPWDCVLRYVGEAAPPQADEAKPSLSAEEGLPELSVGTMGAAVEAMQALLALRGYPCGISGIDGSFGAATLAAVTGFQTSRFLAVDGVCGGQTWGALVRG